jgi:hypothetical protein
MAAKNHTYLKDGTLRYVIKSNSLRARMASWVLRESPVAMVWSNTILLQGISEEFFYANKRWLRHELKHVEQFQRYGFYTFILLYLWESARKGYFNNKYEQEARQAEKDELIEQRFSCLTAH